MSAKNKAYIQLTDLLCIPWNNSKDIQRIAVIVFDIEIDTSCFTPRLFKDKLEKAIKASAKILRQNLVSYIDM